MNRMIERPRYKIGRRLSVIAVTALSGCDDSSEIYCHLKALLCRPDRKWVNFPMQGD